jgi:hypothetical protein
MATKEMTTPSAFASWRVPQFPGAIEYPLEVLEEIRAFACDELLQLSHGGNEVGGVLFGTRREDGIRILTWRPIACEHKQGESLSLSFNDRMNLAVQLELARQNADLKDLRPVGCFISHVRSGVSLSASDLEIYNGFFPDSWQVALVICPKGSGNAEAGFFLREADSKLEARASYQCFDVRPLQIASDTPKASEPAPEPVRKPSPPEPPPAVGNRVYQNQSGGQSGLRSGLPAALRTGAPGAEQTTTPAATQAAPPPGELPLLGLHSPSFQIEDGLPTKERWLWAIPIVLALGIAVFMLYQRRVPPGNGIALHVSNGDQTVQLTWDANSHAIRDSYRGEIAINDGGKQSQVALSSDQLHAGKMSYVPQSSDVAFEISVYPPNGDPIRDSTRLVTPGSHPATQPPQLLPQNQPPVNPAPASPVVASPPPPSPPPASPAVMKAADISSPGQAALEQQVQQLRLQVAKERARADELQNLVRILENRVGIQPSAAPKVGRP